MLNVSWPQGETDRDERGAQAQAPATSLALAIDSTVNVTELTET